MCQCSPKECCQCQTKRRSKTPYYNYVYLLSACVMQNGGTALTAAAHFGHPTVVDLLINAKAPLNAQLLDGSTALFQATGAGHTECVHVLLKSGADANIADKVSTAIYI